MVFWLAPGVPLLASSFAPSVILAMKAAPTSPLVFVIIPAIAALAASALSLPLVMAPITAVLENSWNAWKESEFFFAISFNFSGLLLAILLITAKAILVLCPSPAALCTIWFINLLLVSTLVTWIYLLMASMDFSLPWLIICSITLSLIATKAGLVLLVIKGFLLSDNVLTTVAAASGFVSIILVITSPTFWASDFPKTSASRVFFCSGLVLLIIKSILEIFPILIESDWALISAASTFPSLLESFKVPLSNFFCSCAVKFFSSILEDWTTEVLNAWTSCFEDSGIVLFWKPWEEIAKPWLGLSMFWVLPALFIETDPKFPKLSSDKNIFDCPSEILPLTKVPLNLTSESFNFMIIFPLALLISPLSMANWPPRTSKINVYDFFSISIFFYQMLSNTNTINYVIWICFIN